MSISITHLHAVICFALFFSKYISLPNIIDTTDIIITLSQHESTSRFNKQAKQCIIMHQIHKRASGYKIETIKAYMSCCSCQNTFNLTLNVSANEQRDSCCRERDICLFYGLHESDSNPHSISFHINTPGCKVL